VADAPEPVEIALSGAVTAMSVGTAHTCVALDTGKVNCWGLNESGQLGNGMVGTPLFEPAPQEVLGLLLPTQHLATDLNNTCVIDSAMNAACWGDNSTQQLGLSGPDSGSPTSIGGDGILDIDVGDGHVCLLDGDTVKCGGANNNGQVGNGNTNTPVTSLSTVAINNVKRLALGGNSTCAINTADELSCWGRNVEGQLGNGTSGTNNFVLTPALVNVGAVKDVAIGYQHMCVLTTDDRVLCWGANNHRQLGPATILPGSPIEVVW
jgi:alpha-tubulin suppressor-like RCC1 family protein